MLHYLKILPQHFNDILQGYKKFEVRYKDRDYKADDTLILQEYWNGKYTGKVLSVRVPYILDDEMYCKENFIIMSVENVILLSSEKKFLKNKGA